MSVRLLAIKFNHDVNSATDDAFNIRKNGDEIVIVPEWRAGSTITEPDSVAAYALQSTRGNRITIQAEFASDEPALTAVAIRAIQPPQPVPVLWLQSLLSPLRLSPPLYSYYFQLYSALWQMLTPNPPNVLGEVKAALVTFQAGQSGFVPLELQNTRIATVGVGIHPVIWRWQFRRNFLSPWVEFATTHHRIYTALDVPKLPWVQLPFDRRNTQLPWTQVFDHACSWSDGASSVDDAAGAVTRAVYGLGNGLLEYDCVGLSGPHYTASALVSSPPLFYCTNFLQRLRGLYPDRYVNCVDCATIVSTFANILGCDLWQSRMGYFFELNPTRAIGSRDWVSACGADFFFMHEVAWKDECNDANQVFDACVEVPRNINPLILQPMLPINMVFGGPGDGGYRDHLASAPGRAKCQPRPETRQHKILV